MRVRPSAWARRVEGGGRASRRGFAAIAGLFAAVVALGACREYMPTNRYLQRRPAGAAARSTADARHKFDHDAHASILRQQGITCGDCHRFDAEITAGGTVARAYSGAAQHPGGSACHFCHGPDETRIAAAPQACTTCHDNVWPLLPPDHEIAWSRVHASVASANPVACQNCHRDAFCINCHQARDSVIAYVHPRDFVSYHSIAARANPMECGSCHREDYCINCHSKSAR